MKITKTLLTLIALSVLIYSCSSDDGNTNGNEQLADEQNQLEEAPVPLANINSDISIDGAAKNQGTPPAPNSNINLEIDSGQAEAFQSSGFNLKFSTSETNIAGAYLLFKDSDNNTASDYFDIPVSSFKTNKSDNTKSDKSLKRGPLSKNNNLVDGEYEIDVDFGSSFPPGKFCADLCIYDEQNNISQIVTVCIEVEAWGGNAEIAGEWVFDRYLEDAIEKREVVCENEETITADYYLEDELTWTLVLNENGNYYESYKGFYKQLNIEATRNSCTAEYENSSEEDSKYSGNWAYNEDKKTLTIIDFKFEDFLNASNNKTYENGAIYFDGENVTASIINGELVISDTYTEIDQTYTDTYVFKRK